MAKLTEERAAILRPLLEEYRIAIATCNKLLTDSNTTIRAAANMCADANKLGRINIGMFGEVVVAQQGAIKALRTLKKQLDDNYNDIKAELEGQEK